MRAPSLARRPGSCHGWLHTAACVALALDYPFTGAGLGSFEMAYSSYVVLLHVGFLQHGHNLFLDVWIEQGIIGLLALTWLIAQRRPNASGFARSWCVL